MQTLYELLYCTYLLRYTCIPSLANNVCSFYYFFSIFYEQTVVFAALDRKKLSLVNFSVYAYKLWFSNAFRVFSELYCIFFKVLYSTLLHLPPLRFHYVGGCWDWTQVCYDFVIDSQTLYAKMCVWLLFTCLSNVCLVPIPQMFSCCLVHARLNHFLFPNACLTKPFLIA